MFENTFTQISDVQHAQQFLHPFSGELELHGCPFFIFYYRATLC